MNMLSLQIIGILEFVWFVKYSPQFIIFPVGNIFYANYVNKTNIVAPRCVIWERDMVIKFWLWLERAVLPWCWQLDISWFLCVLLLNKSCLKTQKITILCLIDNCNLHLDCKTKNEFTTPHSSLGVYMNNPLNWPGLNNDPPLHWSDLVS